MDDFLRPLALWMYTTPVSDFVNNQPWVWSTMEIAHFTGLAVMAGAIGVFDLRLLGLAKGLTPSALHRLIVLAVGAFAVNAGTGVLFLFGAPEQYFFNDAFRAKVVLLVLMGANVAAFYGFAHARVNAMAPGEDAPLRVKIIAGVSLFALAGVMLAGRMLTFFRPGGNVLG